MKILFLYIDSYKQDGCRNKAYVNQLLHVASLMFWGGKVLYDASLMLRYCNPWLKLLQVQRISSFSYLYLKEIKHEVSVFLCGLFRLPVGMFLRILFCINIIKKFCFGKNT